MFDCKLVLLHSEFKCEHSVFGQTHASDGILITSVFCFFFNISIHVHVCYGEIYQLD